MVMLTTEGHACFLFAHFYSSREPPEGMHFVKSRTSVCVARGLWHFDHVVHLQLRSVTSGTSLMRCDALFSLQEYWASGHVCFPTLMTLIKGLWPGTMRCLTMADHVFMSRIESPHTTAPAPTHSLYRSFIAFSLLRTTQEHTSSAILSVCHVVCACAYFMYACVCRFLFPALSHSSPFCLQFPRPLFRWRTPKLCT